MTLLTLTLRDTSGVEDNFDINFKLRDTSLSKVWKECFIQNFLESHHPIEKTYCLHGWQTTWNTNYPRNLEYLCEKLNYHIDIINSEMPKYGYPVIDLNFTVDRLKSNSQEELLNKVHHHFELLIGQSWEPSKWWRIDALSNKVRFSIRMLNNLCHEIEAIIQSIKSKTDKLMIYGSLNCIDCKGKHFDNKAFKELTLENYNDFSPVAPFGSINLYYAQLGKTHHEVFFDNDTDIERKNITGTKYVTGEFTCAFKKTNSALDDPKFVNWLKKNSWDINDPTLALKNSPVADLILTTSEEEFKIELLKRDDLYKIKLDNKEKIYDYTYQDQEAWEEKI